MDSKLMAGKLPGSAIQQAFVPMAHWPTGGQRRRDFPVPLLWCGKDLPCCMTFRSGSGKRPPTVGASVAHTLTERCEDEKEEPAVDLLPVRPESPTVAFSSCL